MPHENASGCYTGKCAAWVKHAFFKTHFYCTFNARQTHEWSYACLKYVH